MEAKLLAVLDFLEKKIEAVAKNKGLNGQDGAQGPKGEAGKPGPAGPSGPAGKDGRDGKDGKNGKDGQDGEDGTSVTGAMVDFDNHLVVTLSSGEEIDAGEIHVESQEGDTIAIGMRGGSERDRDVYETSADFQVPGNVGEEIIICTNTSDISVTLPTIPKNGHWVKVKRQGAGRVTVVGQIDGRSNIIISQAYGGPSMVYTDVGQEWSLL